MTEEELRKAWIVGFAQGLIALAEEKEEERRKNAKATLETEAVSLRKPA